ncbi:hypothetical protein LTS18_014138, partial [Coniosporium uncinatum]
QFCWLLSAKTPRESDWELLKADADTTLGDIPEASSSVSPFERDFTQGWYLLRTLALTSFHKPTANEPQLIQKIHKFIDDMAPPTNSEELPLLPDCHFLERAFLTLEFLKACTHLCHVLLNPKEPKAKNRTVISQKASIESLRKLAAEKAQGFKKVIVKWEAELKANGHKRVFRLVEEDVLGKRVEEIIGKDFVEGCVREIVESAVDALQGIGRVKVD